jgi:hypothetical protein
VTSCTLGLGSKRARGYQGHILRTSSTQSAAERQIRKSVCRGPQQTLAQNRQLAAQNISWLGCQGLAVLPLESVKDHETCIRIRCPASLCPCATHHFRQSRTSANDVVYADRPVRARWRKSGRRPVCARNGGYSRLASVRAGHGTWPEGRSRSPVEANLGQGISPSATLRAPC